MQDFLGDYTYYILAAIAVIIGLLILRYVAGCIVRLIVVLVLLALLAGGYVYFFEPELYEELTGDDKTLIEHVQDKGNELIDKAKDKGDEIIKEASDEVIEEVIEKAKDQI